MKITLDLPDWIKERHIRVFAGIEEVAKKYTGTKWKIKKVRCDMCGKCCMEVPKNWRLGVDKKTGWCQHLQYYANEYRCNAPGGRPFYCCCGDAEDQDFCCVKWKVKR